MASRTYSFLNFKCALTGPGGAINLGDGAGVSEEGITFDPVEDTNTMVVGADGAGMHSLNASKAGTITVRLLKTSPTNQLLSAMYAFQRASSESWGQNTISGVDKARGDVVVAQQCAFKRTPSISYAKQAGFVEWTWDAVVIDVTLGA